MSGFSSHMTLTLSLAALSIICSIMLIKKIGNKYDEILRGRGLPLPFSASAFILPASWSRANLYSAYILRNPSSKLGYGKLIAGFNFRKHATFFDIAISLVHMFLLASFILSLFL